MNRRQGYVIIALLAVIAVALAVLVGVLVASGGDRQGAAVGQGPPPTSSAETASEEITDPAAALEEAGVDVVMPPPVPDAPAAWGDYELDRDWNGQVRVFRDSAAQAIAGAGDDRFPATMNRCGSGMYFVTFRATGNGTIVDAQLVDAVGRINDSRQLPGGWMLGTNCSTPHFAFHSANSQASLVDVAYTVYEYRQTSVAKPIAPSEPRAPVAPDPPPAPPAPAQPTLVQCESGLSATGMFSDGVRRQDERCRDERAAEIEGVCGGLYWWENASRERYIELCGKEPPPGG